MYRTGHLKVRRTWDWAGAIAERVLRSLRHTTFLIKVRLQYMCFSTYTLHMYIIIIQYTNAMYSEYIHHAHNIVIIIVRCSCVWLLVTVCNGSAVVQ